MLLQQWNNAMTVDLALLKVMSLLINVVTVNLNVAVEACYCSLTACKLLWFEYNTSYRNSDTNFFM